jgi:hypothetical protein
LVLKIIVAGSRDITDYECVRQAFIESGYWKQYKHSIEVVCGMAKGIDLLGRDFAQKNGLKVHEFPANWKLYGKAAGHIRNVQMGEFAKASEGRLLAVWDGKSRGTLHMIQWARDNGLKGFIYRTDKPARYAKIGMKVRTDFSGKHSTHIITDIDRERKHGHSQSGVMFLVNPPVPKSGGEWVDADWFDLV